MNNAIYSCTFRFYAILRYNSHTNLELILMWEIHAEKELPFIMKGRKLYEQFYNYLLKVAYREE